MPERKYYFYLLSNKINTVIYAGMCNDLIKRVYKHRHSKSGFTARYKVHKLVYYEYFETKQEAIKREKQIKAGSRKKKIDLINDTNPEWKDLYDELI